MDNTLTFKLLNYYCDLYGESLSFDEILKNKIRSVFDNNKKIEYTKLLKQLYGVFPSDLFKFLNANEINKICFFEEKSSDYANFSNCCVKLPPEHLGNFEWRFSKESAKRLSYVVSNNDIVSCLGTPTLFVELINREFGDKVYLFDINTPIIDVLKTYSNDESCISYNVMNKVGSKYIDKFDTVYINPPWHLDYYKIFIYRAFQMLKKGNSRIIMPLFPILSSHSSIEDLKQIKNYIYDNFKGQICSVKSLGIFEFNMPGFEKKIFVDNNIPVPSYNWRECEMIEICFEKQMNLNNCEHILMDYIDWDRIYDSDTNSLCFINKDFDGKKEDLDFQNLMTLSRNKISKYNIYSWTNENLILC